MENRAPVWLPRMGRSCGLSLVSKRAAVGVTVESGVTGINCGRGLELGAEGRHQVLGNAPIAICLCWVSFIYLFLTLYMKEYLN